MLHLKSLKPPEPASNEVLPQESTPSVPQPPATPSSVPTPVPEDAEDVPVLTEVQEGHVWSGDYTVALEKFLSLSVINKLKQMYEEGPEPPFVSDSGWGSRQAKQEELEIAESAPVEATSKRGRGRGGGGRSGNRGLRASKREDTRRVVTEVCTFSLYIHVAE